MSRFDALTAGLGFRTTTPQFEVGEEILAIVTGREGNDAIVRIGDTVLRMPGSDLHVDDEAIIRVTAFDPANATGEATFVEAVDVDTPE
jgi:hypothetical protein